MNEYELMQNSIHKNIQELSEFCVDDMHVNNFYDLCDLMVNLWNIRAKLKKKDEKLYKKIIKELEEI